MSHFDSPNRNLWRPWLLIAGFVGLGLLLSVWLYEVLHQRHRHEVANELDALITLRVHALDNYHARSLEALFGLAVYLQDPGNRNRPSFQRYAEGSLARLPELQALEWIPRIEGAERQAFEAAAQASAQADYRIIEFDQAGQLRPAKTREVYYPVLLAYPETLNIEAVGLDLASQPDRLAAIRNAELTGEIAATAPVRLAQEKVDEVYGVLIFAPVFELAPNPAKLAGFSLAVYRTVDLLSAVFGEMAERGLAVEVVDAERPQAVLFSNHQAFAGPELRAASLQATRTFNLGSRDWRIQVAATPAYVTGANPGYVVVYPVLCALLVLAFGLYAAARNRYTLEVENEVRSRTLALTEEVEQRREAEAAAQVAERMYRSIFDNAIDGIFQSTADGRYLNANPALAGIYGYDSPREFIDSMQNIGTQLYVDSHRRDEFVALMQRDGKVSQFVSEVYRKDGSRIFILEKAISVSDSAGQFLYFEGNVQDITDRLKAEQALQTANEWLEERVQQRTIELADANRELQEEVRVREAAERRAAEASVAKTQFLANMSHEIRTPLNAIIGYSQLLQQADDIPGNHHQALSTIAQSGDHLLRLIDDILDLSKIEAGHLELQTDDFDLALLVQNVAFIVRKKCEEKALRLKVEGLGPHPAWVQGDEIKLRQILINLLTNAVKYTREGEIILRVVPEDELTYRFEVIDTGPGIPGAELARIFDQFYQRGHWQEGTGLGLSIASRLAKILQSELKVQSTPGCGSNFFFQMGFAPAKQPQPRAAMSGERLAGLKPGATCKALVVDDVAHNREILRQMLSTLDIDAVSVASGREAMEYVALRQPDIIFLDILMPDADGFAVREALLEQYPALAARFVAFTASSYREQWQHYLDVGFDDVIAKPFHVSQLHQCLAFLLPHLFSLAPLEPQTPADTAQPAQMPAELLTKLADAARHYNVTQLKKGLQALAEHSAGATELAEHLQTFVSQHRLPALAETLERILAAQTADGSQGATP